MFSNREVGPSENYFQLESYLTKLTGVHQNVIGKRLKQKPKEKKFIPKPECVQEHGRNKMNLFEQQRDPMLWEREAYKRWRDGPEDRGRNKQCAFCEVFVTADAFQTLDATDWDVPMQYWCTPDCLRKKCEDDKQPVPPWVFVESWFRRQNPGSAPVGNYLLNRERWTQLYG